MHFFDDNGTIRVSSSTDFQKGVKILVLSRSESQDNPTEDICNFPTRALDAIRKKAMKITNPQKHLLDRENSAIYEKQRYKSPRRKQYEEDYVSSGKRLQVESTRKEKDQETGRRKEIEKRRYSTSNRKLYEEEFVSSGKRDKVEKSRKEKDEETERRKEIEKKRNATQKIRDY